MSWLALGVATAQTTVTTPGGYANIIPVFSGGSSITNSPISITGSNVGVGITNPGTPFSVNLTAPSSGYTSFATVVGNPNVPIGGVTAGIRFGWGGDTLGPTIRTVHGGDFSHAGLAFSIWQDAAEKEVMRVANPGYVGIGTTTPAFPLDVGGIVNASSYYLNGVPLAAATPTPTFTSVRVGTIPSTWFTGANLDPAAFNQMGQLANSMMLMQGANLTAGGGEQDFISNRGAGITGGFRFYDYTNSGQLNALVTMTGQGQVGIGTTNPNSTLEVDGNITLTQGSGASIKFPDGTVQSTAYVGSACATGGDYAESVDVTGQKAAFEPGDVISIDPDHPGHFVKSSSPYSTLVAGIYSTKPGFTGRRQSGPQGAGEIPMAMVGIVPTKVSAESGPIHTGDLLVTSTLLGYAMKGSDGTRTSGAIVGKALGDLKSGTGVIEVLVSLQ